MHKNGRASWKRSLALVWLGEAFSVLTSSVLQMGLIWHVALTTGSAGALSLVSFAGFLPMAVLGVFAGTIVDRSSTKRLMIGATGGFKHQGVSCVLAIVLFGVMTLASGLLPASAFALFLAFTFAMGVSSPLYSSPQMALMQRKVDPDCLGRVFGLYGAVCSWAMSVGLIFSTLFADSIGVTRCFVLVGAAMLVLAALSWSIKRIRTIDQH